MTLKLGTSPHPQYNRYIDPKNFKKFTIEHGNVVWGKNWDMTHFGPATSTKVLARILLRHWF